MNTRPHRRAYQSAFTVIEALVAISMLLLAVSSSFAIGQSSLQSSSLVKNKIVAYYLAQEGIEYIRHMRDNNGLAMLKNKSDNSMSWLDGYAHYYGDWTQNDPCSIGNVCRVDITNQVTPLTQCQHGICPNLYIEQSSGLFQYGTTGSAVDSGFVRSISIGGTGTSDQREIQVVVTVSWTQNGVSKSLVLSENLYNWQQIQEID